MDPLRSPIPLEEIEPAARPVEVAIGLPPACYTGAGFYRFEKAAVCGQDFFRSKLAEWLMGRYRAADEAATANS